MGRVAHGSRKIASQNKKARKTKGHQTSESRQIGWGSAKKSSVATKWTSKATPSQKICILRLIWTIGIPLKEKL
jgi:hypothetical protein